MASTTVIGKSTETFEASFASSTRTWSQAVPAVWAAAVVAAARARSPTPARVLILMDMTSARAGFYLPGFTVSYARGGGRVLKRAVQVVGCARLRAWHPRTGAG